jgi:hypothetical protein
VVVGTERLDKFELACLDATSLLIFIDSLAFEPALWKLLGSGAVRGSGRNAVVIVG